MEVLGIVPARAGSKGVPNKNTREVAGRPLIEWTLEAGLECSAIGRLIVTTDCHRVMQACWRLGVEYVERPSHLATDTANALDAELHVLNAVKANGYVPDVLCRLQPTSPLRTANDIGAVVSNVTHQQCVAAMSVHRVDDHPYLMGTVSDAGYWVAMMADHWLVPRQAYPPYYRINGAVFCARREYWQRNGYVGPRTRPVVIPPERGLDIDTESDLMRAHVALEFREQLRTAGDA